MNQEEKREDFESVESLVDRLLMFQNPEAFREFREMRDALRGKGIESLQDLVNLPANRGTTPPVQDEYQKSFQSRQRRARGPMVGGRQEDFKLQSKADLEESEPERSVFSKKSEPAEESEKAPPTPISELPKEQLDSPKARIDA